MIFLNIDVNTARDLATYLENRNVRISADSPIRLVTHMDVATKDINQVNGYTPGYSLYYNDTTLFKKKNCLYNPPDAKIIAC